MSFVKQNTYMFSDADINKTGNKKSKSEKVCEVMWPLWCIANKLAPKPKLRLMIGCLVPAMSGKYIASCICNKVIMLRQLSPQPQNI